MIHSCIWLKRLCKTAVVASMLLSSMANAWSPSTYNAIIGTAERLDKSSYDRVQVHNVPSSTGELENLRFIDVYQVPLRSIRELTRLYRKYNESVPHPVRQIASGRDWDKSAIILRSRGFAKPLHNNLSYSYNKLWELASRESNPELKINLVAYLVYLRVNAYQPNNTVIFMDNRSFSQGDYFGYDYCIDLPRRDIGQCGNRNLHEFLGSIVGSGPLTTSTVPHGLDNIDDVITASADQARVLYTLQPNTRVTNQYTADARTIMLQQASKAAADVVLIWRHFYGHGH